MGYTMEPSKKHQLHPRIIEGRYPLGWRFSPRFQVELVEIKNVPGRKYLMFHALNRAIESQGCVGIGKERLSHGFIKSSKDATDAFNLRMQKYLRPGECYLTIIDLATTQ
jgi:hypothetical protein